MVGVKERFLVLSKIFVVSCYVLVLVWQSIGNLGAGVFDVVFHWRLSELCRVDRPGCVCQDTDSCDYWESEIRRYNLPLHSSFCHFVVIDDRTCTSGVNKLLLQGLWFHMS